MSVSAVSRSKHRPDYASRGSHAEIAAPGGDFDDGGEDGIIWQVTIHPDFNDPFTIIVPRFDVYALVGTVGTSSSTAHVSGVAALVMSQGDRTPASAEKLLTRTAEDIGTAGRDNDFGFGLVNARSSLFGLGIRR